MSEPFVAFDVADSVAKPKQRGVSLRIGEWHFVIAAAKWGVDPDDE